MNEQSKTLKPDWMPHTNYCMWCTGFLLLCSLHEWSCSFNHAPVAPPACTFFSIFPEYIKTPISRGKPGKNETTSY